jgi:hypothetical protein
MASFPVKACIYQRFLFSPVAFLFNKGLDKGSGPGFNDHNYRLFHWNVARACYFALLPGGIVHQKKAQHHRSRVADRLQYSLVVCLFNLPNLSQWSRQSYTINPPASSSFSPVYLSAMR